MDVNTLIAVLLPTPGAPYDSPGLTAPRPKIFHIFFIDTSLILFVTDIEVTSTLIYSYFIAMDNIQYFLAYLDEFRERFDSPRIAGFEKSLVKIEIV
jgi:hypothetical protein